MKIELRSDRHCSQVWETPAQSILQETTETIKVKKFRMSKKDEGDAQVRDENPSPWNERHPVALLFSEREGREGWVEKIAEESRLKAWTSGRSVEVLPSSTTW